MRIKWLSGHFAGQEQTVPYRDGARAVSDGLATCLDTPLERRCEAAEFMVAGPGPDVERAVTTPRPGKRGRR